MSKKILQNEHSSHEFLVNAAASLPPLRAFNTSANEEPVGPGGGYRLYVTP